MAKRKRKRKPQVDYPTVTMADLDPIELARVQAAAALKPHWRSVLLVAPGGMKRVKLR